MFNKMLNEMFNAVIEVPFGKMGINTDEHQVQQIVYLPPTTGALLPNNAVALRAATQISRYFKHPAVLFDLPLADLGSVFQRRVWQAISKIAVGRVATYRQIAASINSSPRAVGQACGANPFPLIIPCHRVVSSHGIGGFIKQANDKYFTEIKRWLLTYERVDIEI